MFPEAFKRIMLMSSGMGTVSPAMSSNLNKDNPCPMGAKRQAVVSLYVPITACSRSCTKGGTTFAAMCPLPKPRKGTRPQRVSLPKKVREFVGLGGSSAASPGRGPLRSHGMRRAQEIYEGTGMDFVEAGTTQERLLATKSHHALAKELDLARKWLLVTEKHKVPDDPLCLLLSLPIAACKDLWHWRSRKMFKKHGKSDAFRDFMVEHGAS